MPPPIYVSIKHPVKADVHGMAEMRQVRVDQVVHHAPKGIEGRKAILVLKTDEAFQLGVDLVGTIPLNFVIDCKDAEEKASRLKQLTRIKKFVEVLIDLPKPA